MPKLHVHTPFTLRHDDGSLEQFTVGERDIPVAVAEHWYVKHHTRAPGDAPTPAAAPVDGAEMEKLRAELDAAREQLDAEREELTRHTTALDFREADLDTREKAVAGREAALDARAAEFEAAQKAAEKESAKQTGAGKQQNGKQA